MNVMTAFLIQRILSPTGPGGFGAVIGGAPACSRAAEIKHFRAASPATRDSLPLAA